MCFTVFKVCTILLFFAINLNVVEDFVDRQNLNQHMNDDSGPFISIYFCVGCSDGRLLSSHIFNLKNSKKKKNLIKAPSSSIRFELKHTAG